MWLKSGIDADGEVPGALGTADEDVLGSADEGALGEPALELALGAADTVAVDVAAGVAEAVREQPARAALSRSTIPARPPGDRSDEELLGDIG
jgi:hypothetical protein